MRKRRGASARANPPGIRASHERRAPCAMPPLSSRVMRLRPPADAGKTAAHRDSNIAYHHNQFPRFRVSS
ncbi:hypothetical protein WT08_24120 [Burkholderia sp. MSMB1552]|nr:hypothetical protein AQ610_31295 [Burkholderia humptydooensis]KVN03209.1 hypothetical protein WT08_24120 [Burkholderia sp. MSMB1552]KWZ49868.1 hypothetical protein WS92_20600 [Burkholderia sp. MSMB1588]